MEIKKTEKVVKNTYYICENCGTKHSYKGNIFKSFISDKEICTHCAKSAELYNVDLNDYDTVKVHPSEVQNGYDFEDSMYWTAIHIAKQEYSAIVTILNKKYLQNDDDFLRNYIDKRNK